MVPRPDSKLENTREEYDLIFTKPQDRTVNDYETCEQVKEALAECPLSGRQDWVLDKFEKSTSIENPNCIEYEANRLLCLKSYHMLDTPPEIEFEEITMEAKKFFGCPIVVLSLIDMGRQWFKSIQGLDVESTPRCLAFCSHVVKRKADKGVLVVPDATKDARFKDNELVTGGPLIRFYAGASMLAPEGHRIGSFCVIDTEAHPEGLSTAEKERLRFFATECVYNMIARDDC
jgi:GAF domain-containing protein